MTKGNSGMGGVGEGRRGKFKGKGQKQTSSLTDLPLIALDSRKTVSSCFSFSLVTN